MVNNGNVVTTSKITSDLSDEDVKSVLDSVNGGFYNIKVGKTTKRVPDSRLMSSLANNKLISLEVVEVVKTSEFARATMRARNNRNGHAREGTVTHYYRDVLQDKLLSMLKADKEEYSKWVGFPANKDKKWSKGCFVDLDNPFTIDDYGNMIPNLNNRGKKKIVRDMITFKKFAERDAQTKAERLVITKILNQNWMGREEEDSELDEVKNVNKL